MTTHNAAATSHANGSEASLRELTFQMIRFTNAVTLFSMQQMQNALGAVTDSQGVIKGFSDALKDISDTLATKIDASKSSALKSMTRTESDLVDRVENVMRLPAMDELVDITAKVTRRVADSLTDLITPGPATHSSSAAEPEHLGDAGGRKK
jgi:hypothetical protein